MKDYRLQPMLDLGLGVPAFILASPLILLISLIILFSIGKPVFFRQVRPGKNGRPFRMIKFRTMTNACDENGNLLSDAERLTSFGRFLRSTSLDELPELMNVLNGDLSLVGPRPLLMQYIDRYSTDQARRHEVKPGLSGWAQVNGRNAIRWEEKFNLDVWYVDHQSLWLDIKIIGMTLKRVLAREGISHQGEATMCEFTGDGRGE